MDHRGFASVEEMNETMIEKWNARVRKKDEVVIIGDLSFGSVQETNELVRRLRGRLYLIKGNHDRYKSSAENSSLSPQSTISLRIGQPPMQCSLIPHSGQADLKIFRNASNA